mmetsp:Transcript_9818/g.18470  ORF Transcript_9818/g.18470 Transcript_9818/m.18470 type:complete len:82 (-) Transcript_9818:245-490(-)
MNENEFNCDKKSFFILERKENCLFSITQMKGGSNEIRSKATKRNRTTKKDSRCQEAVKINQILRKRTIPGGAAVRIDFSDR